MSIPSERVEQAPLLRVFGELAPRIADLLRARPSLMSRLIFAPRPAIHSVAAFLHLSPEADRADHEVAAMIGEVDPRELLRAAISDAPARLYRALDRAGDHARHRQFYLRVAALCRTPLVTTLLDGDLNGPRLAWLEMLLTHDKAVVALHGVLPDSLSLGRALDTVVALLRDHGAPVDELLAMPRGVRLPAVLRRVLQALDHLEAPPLPYVLPSPYRIILTVGDLRRAGARLNNCLASPGTLAGDHWCSLIEGSRMYVTGDDPPVLAALRRAGPRLWLLEELTGHGSEEGTPDQRDALLAALRRSGVQLVHQPPSRAIGTLARHIADAAASGDDFSDEFEGWEAA